ncbi:D-beta-hydroxybutyrate dehydrogenase, mitochondrial-like [Argonauta hians]
MFTIRPVHILCACLIIGAVAVLQPEQLKYSDYTPSIALTIIVLGLVSILAFALLPTHDDSPLCSENKAVVITGCDTGFGHSLAKRLYNQGYTVYAGCLFSDQSGAKELRNLNSDRMHVVQIDVTCDEQVDKAVEYVKSTLGSKELWALVNNAGMASFGEIEWISVEQFKRIMDVNVIGVVRMTKAFLPFLRIARGRVVNVASLAGRYTLPAFAAYSMSKVACIAFSDGLRQEMGKFGIKVIIIEPGLYKTPISTNIPNDTKRRWDNTPSDIKEVYGEEYFKEFLTVINKQLNRARENVEEVVDLMVLAVTSSKPKLRYVPYWVTNIRSTIIMYLPSTLRDKLFKSFIPRVEPKCIKDKSA